MLEPLMVPTSVRPCRAAGGGGKTGASVSMTSPFVSICRRIFCCGRADVEFHLDVPPPPGVVLGLALAAFLDPLCRVPYGMVPRFNRSKDAVDVHCWISATNIIFLLCRGNARFPGLPYRQTEVFPSGSYVGGWKLATPAWHGLR